MLICRAVRCFLQIFVRNFLTKMTAYICLYKCSYYCSLLSATYVGIIQGDHFIWLVLICYKWSLWLEIDAQECLNCECTSNQSNSRWYRKLWESPDKHSCTSRKINKYLVYCCLKFTLLDFFLVILHYLLSLLICYYWIN